MVDGEPNRDAAFSDFVRDCEPRLRAALVARYGPSRGRDATAEALAWAWEHWDRVTAMENPAGYLYRVGQSKTRWRRSGALAEATSRSDDAPLFEPRLPAALDSLTWRQRQAVVLAHGYGLTHAEIADLLRISRSSVQNHVERGLAKLRDELEAHGG